MANHNLTIQKFYKNYVSTWGALGTLIGGFPLFSGILREDLASFTFPPLGQFTLTARVGALFLAAGVTFITFSLKDALFLRSRSRRTKALCWTFIGSFVALLMYLSAHHQFVREIPIPAEHATFQVSIGYERTEFAEKEFRNMDDWEMLRQRGTTEEEISRLWTSKSILISRLSLFISYQLTLLALVFMCSLGVLFDAYGTAPDP